MFPKLQFVSIKILSFANICENSLFAIHDNNGIKLLTRFRLNFNHLSEHKFRNNFLGTINSLCSCGSEPETTPNFLLLCQNHVISRSKLLKFKFNLNKEIIKLTVCYLKDTELFDESLIWNIHCFFLFVIIIIIL